MLGLPIRKNLITHLDNYTKKKNINYLYIDQYFEGIEKETTIAKDMHWNAYGHVIAAQGFTDFLIEKKFIPESDFKVRVKK